MNPVIVKIVTVYAYVFLFYFLAIYVGKLLVALASVRRVRRYVSHVRTDPYVAADYTKPVSILLPCYNAESDIVQTVEALLNLEYSLFEVVVINDGSSDDTLRELVNHFDLRAIDVQVKPILECGPIRGMYASLIRPNLVLIDKETGGRADALNAGLNASRYPLFCAIDNGTIIEKRALVALSTPFMEDETTLFSAGRIRLANGSLIDRGEMKQAGAPVRFLQLFQAIEYLRNFLTHRNNWESMGAPYLNDQSFTLYRKAVVQEVGGYRGLSGEEMDLNLRVHAYVRQNLIPYRVAYTPRAECWVQGPETFGGLYHQRTRWHYDLLVSLWRYKGMLLNPRYGAIGFLALPFYWLITLLSPVLEGLGFLMALVAVATQITPLFYGLAIGLILLYHMFFSVLSIFLEELSLQRLDRPASLIRLVIGSLLEPVFFHPLTVLWRIRAFLGYRPARLAWGQVELGLPVPSQHDYPVVE